MVRPCKNRRVKGRPDSPYFKPVGKKMFELEETILSLPEFEAIRLIDLEEVSQEEASKRMEISQPTLSRILKLARRKISEAIIKGKAIRITKT